MRKLRSVLVPLCVCAAFAAGASAGSAQVWPQPPRPLPTPAPQPQPTRQPREGQPPTMKRPGEIEVPPARARRSYDRARDATYVNIDIKLLARPAAAPRAAEKAKGKDRDKAAAAAPAPAFEGREVTLTFQLAYRGAHTYDLIAAYLIVESVAPPGAGDKLAGARQLVVGADPYEFTYERADYREETVALAGAATASTPHVRREVAAFPVPTEDLRPIANAGRISIKVGSEGFAVRSAQLTELRRTLTAGVDQ